MISVIVPFYYGNKYILKLMDSISESIQYAKKRGMEIFVELILVNDSPKEKVKLPNKEYSFTIKILENTVNLGIQETRINGLLSTKAEYILFLDQDDIIFPEFFYTQLKTIMEEKADIVVGNACIEEKDHKRVFYNKFTLSCVCDIKWYEYINNQIFSPGQCLIRRNAIPKFWYEHKLKINGADDFMLWLLLFENKCKFVVNSCIVYVHSYTGENLSYDLDKMHQSVLEMVEVLKVNRCCDISILSNIINCSTYKNMFRKSNKIKKALLSIKFFRFFIMNVWYALNSKLNGGIR